MKKINICLASFVAVALSTWVQAAELNMLSSWNTNYAGAKYTVPKFAEMVKERVPDLTLDVKGPEAVSPFEQLEPVQAGLYQFVYTHGGYHYGTTGIGMGMDGVDGDPDKRRASGIWDFVDKSYNEIGLKLIAMPTSGDGYHMVLKNPIGSSGGLDGAKVRGTPVYKALIEHLGGTLVVLPPAEIYSALDKGTVDGAAWPVLAALGFKWYETAGYMMRPRFGDVTHLILMNLGAWNNLSSAQQSALTQVGIDLEKETWGQFYGLADTEVVELKKLGMKETKLGSKYANDLPKVFSDGLFGLVIKKNGARGEEFAKLARSAKLAP